MYANWRIPTCGFLGALLSICATASCAEEKLVMPFRCSMMAGRPVLTPSQDEGYRILGQHEQRTFTACSPANPDTCKQWTVHRFDLECEGARVPWASVAVAADGPRNPRAWIEDGQVRVRMGPWWNMPAGDPCARAGLYEDRWQARQFARYCAERRGSLPPSVVDMPAGFAPMLGTGGFFVGAGPRSAGPPPPQVASGLPPAHAVPSRPPPPPRETTKEVAKRQPAPPDQTSKTPPPALAAAPASPAPASPAPAAAPPAPAPAGTAEHPTIINRPEQPPEAAPPAPKQPPSNAEEGAAKFGAPALKRAVEQLPPAPAREDSRKDAGKDTQKNTGKDTGTDQSIEVSLITMAGTPVAMLAGLAMVAAFTAGTFAWLRKHERTTRAGAASREFASVSLTPAQNALTIPDNVEPDAGPPSPPVQSGSTFVRGPTWVPRNRAEALTVLGMGVTPDATQVAIKRIVDGLRLSWHPDHAKDEPDRQMREARLKQINAAWDILHGVPAEA
ncbi:MAG TPA: hypothetical protein VLL28_12340 [Hyphomicrobiaceae bacterium]|nr:hypothetical protein [Hyphomicrobiaceae bacterium]